MSGGGDQGAHRRVGTVTIGQSPRSDLAPDLLALLGPGVELVEEGALNGLAAEEIARLAPLAGEPVLVSRLRNGSQARLNKALLPPLIQAAFGRLAGRVDVILMLCTGSLPRFDSPCAVLYPEELLFRVVSSILGGASKRFGVITPVAEQVPDQRRRWWAATGIEPAVGTCSPYEADGLEENLRRAALQLKAEGAHMIVLDCLGYSRRMKRLVRESTGLPVVLARGLLARVAVELLDCGEGEVG